MADIKISEMTTAAILNGAEVSILSQSQGGQLVSVKATLQAIANWFAVNAEYTNALNTQDKRICGAINELKQLISLIPQFSIEVVQTLPTEDISDTTIYLVPAEDPEVGNYYEEYIYVNNTWELVGSTAVDLSAYYTKLEVDAKFSALATVATSGSYNDLINKPDLSALMDVHETTFENPYIKKVVPSGQYTEKLKKLIGASVVWNQLMPISSKASATVSSIAVTNNNDGSYTLNGTWDNSAFNFWLLGGYNQTAEVFRFVANHIYISKGLNFYNKTTSKTANALLDKTLFVKFTEDTIITGIKTANPSTAGQTFTNHTIYPMIFDLTAMFGTAIADRAYAMEQAEAGSGIAWLQSYGFFSDQYNAYDAGSLQSVSLAAKKNVGFNQCDEQFVSGGWNANTGASAASSTSVRNVNPIPINPNWSYYVKASANVYLFFYDASGAYIGYNGSSRQNQIITPATLANSKAPSTTFTNAKYMNVRYDVASYAGDFCFNVSDENRNGTYEPYMEDTTALDSTPLRGLFGLDANNNIVANGDEYTPDGAEAVKYAEEDMGSKSWTYGSTSGTYYAQFGSIKTNTLRALAEKYIFAGNTAPGDLSDRQFSVYNTNYVYVKDSASPTGKILYELATPTTATLTPYEKLQAIEPRGTEEFVDYGVQSGTRDVAIPAGNESVYGDNELMGKVVNYMTT